MGVLKLENVTYSYNKGSNKIIDNMSYYFEKGKIYAIIGKSGSGKTTLLSLLSNLANPTEGKILYEDKNIKSINQYEYRSKYVGVIFQGFNLLPQLTAVENVELSIDISGKKIKNKKEHSLEMLKKVNISDTNANRRILKLSGGEQQRVSIARTLAYNPDIILADEPTGNLDLDTQEEVMNIFKKLAKEENKCIIIVTHSPEVADMADVLYELTPLKKYSRDK